LRARLIPHWPALSEIWGLHPFDFDRLSAAEWASYMDAFEEKAYQARRQQARG